ncbi:hypothetical protein ACLI1A_16530 [Flavobacterium sp. RHBU_3]|uniref:hypothetical protein n=1 Tax=Flavobacterium sp. RHBU_3 TaxID=3391184 RepID=UPI0039853131
MDYIALEKDFDCTCRDVITQLSVVYKTEYYNGSGRLETFLDLIKTNFEKVEQGFIEKNKLTDNTEAIKRIRKIARGHAKLCLDDYGKLL